MNPFRLDGRKAVVTGGGSGIGKSIAERFYEAGASVCILDVDLPAANATAEKIRSSGGSARAHRCDVSDHAGVKSVFEDVIRDGPVHILVNNAGISHVGTLESTSETDFDRIFRVNVKGMYNCMFALIPHMKSHGGVILNMASIAASTGLNDRFAYSMSKGAVFHRLVFTRRLWTDTFINIILAEKLRCSRSFLKLSPLGEWRSREKSPTWRYSCAPMKLRSSRARTIRLTVASSSCMADSG
jgi:NAD(P)-dependent dehydrogenase (short-subunit alcohol dehydrogenase family)